MVDLQDVGSRYYTFVNTMAYCMEVAKRTGTEVIVLDRPNPIDGSQSKGTCSSRQLLSFVGQFALPVRHGMTIGELAQLFHTRSIGCKLDGHPDAGMEARDVVGRDRPAVGAPVAEHAHARHGNRLSRHVPDRGDES